MSTNHTPNFNLSQWEETDKVLRTDFNADNAKIDAALFCHPSAELIAKVTVEEEMDLLDIDISELDWGRYMALALIVDAIEFNGFRLSIGGIERSAYLSSNSQNVYYNHSILDVANAAYLTALIPVFYDGSHKGSAISITFGQSDKSFLTHFAGGAGSNRLEQCKQIRIFRKQNGFVPGDRAVLWGVK